MKKYCGNSKPYIYVSFPEGKKEQALSVLEKLSASEEGKKLNFWYSDKNTLGGKERKRIEAAHALLVFADGGSLADERFKETVNTAADKNRNVMCVHLDELKYDTPWAKTQLGPQQAIRTRDYSNGDELVEKLKTAEIFRDVRVTSEQKRARRRQLGSLIAVPAALAVLAAGYMYMTGSWSDKNEIPPPEPSFTDVEPEIVLKLTGYDIQGTQQELDEITSLVYFGNDRFKGSFSPYDMDSGFMYDVGEIFEPAMEPGRLGGFNNNNVTRSKIYASCKNDKYTIETETGDKYTLKSLANLRNLRELTIAGNHIANLAPIYGLTDLEALCIDCNPIESLDGIEALKNLKFLSINCTNVSDLTPVFKLENLETLYASGSRVTSVEGIEALKNLKNVNLKFTDLSDITGLCEGGSIERLDISMSLARGEITGMEKCRNLKYFNIQKTNISAVSPFPECFLDEVRISDTNIKDYSFLSTAKGYDKGNFKGRIGSTLAPAMEGQMINNLNWGDADIKSISELNADPSSFSTLSLENCTSLTSLEGIEKYPNCYALDLMGCNRIKDLTPLTRRDWHGCLIALDPRLKSKADRQLADLDANIFYNMGDFFSSL